MNERYRAEHCFVTGDFNAARTIRSFAQVNKSWKRQHKTSQDSADNARQRKTSPWGWLWSVGENKKQKTWEMQKLLKLFPARWTTHASRDLLFWCFWTALNVLEREAEEAPVRFQTYTMVYMVILVNRSSDTNMHVHFFYAVCCKQGERFFILFNSFSRWSNLVLLSLYYYYHYYYFVICDTFCTIIRKWEAKHILYKVGCSLVLLHVHTEISSFFFSFFRPAVTWSPLG